MKESNIGTSLILLNRSWSWIGNLASQRRHKVPMACLGLMVYDFWENLAHRKIEIGNKIIFSTPALN